MHRGAISALVLSNFLYPLMVIVYIKHSQIHLQTWQGWSHVSLRGWMQFLRLAIPGMVMICLDWWTLEIINFVAGTFDEITLTSNVIIIQIITMISIVSG